MAQISPVGIDFEIYPALDTLPIFNFDFDENAGPEVTKWRAALADADLVLLVSPEYAHGVTGVIKNALDWIVGSGELVDKPMAFPNVSVRAEIAQAHLNTTLSVMGARVIPECSPVAKVGASLIEPELTSDSMLENPDLRKRLELLWRNISTVLEK